MTAQVTIFKDADVALTVVDGTPPVDQSALVANLRGQLDSLQKSYDTLTASFTALQAKVTKAQADLA